MNCATRARGQQHHGGPPGPALAALEPVGEQQQQDARAERERGGERAERAGQHLGEGVHTAVPEAREDARRRCPADRRARRPCRPGRGRPRGAVRAARAAAVPIGRNPPDFSPSILTDIASRGSARDLDPEPKSRHPDDIAPSRTVSSGERVHSSQRQEEVLQGAGKARQATASWVSRATRCWCLAVLVGRAAVRRHGLALAAAGRPQLARRHAAGSACCWRPSSRSSPSVGLAANKSFGFYALLGRPLRPGDRTRAWSSTTRPARERHSRSSSTQR